MTNCLDTAVDFALAQQGKPYRNDAHRFGPDHFDCSGLVVAALDYAQITRPEWALDSGAILRWGQEVGSLMSVGAASMEFGALLIRHGTPIGHVCFSLGNGETMEAMGTAYGCRKGHSAGRGFNYAMRVPGAVRCAGTGGAPGGSPAPSNVLRVILAASTHTLKVGSSGTPVRILQQILVDRGYGVGHFGIDGQFGASTDAAVRAFQRHEWITQDGIVGPTTWHHLLT